MQEPPKDGKKQAGGSPRLYVLTGAAVAVAATSGTVILHRIIDRIAAAQDHVAHREADALIYVLAAFSVIFIELLLILLYRVNKRQVRQIEQVAERGIADQAELFRVVLENAPVAIFAVDKGGILTLRKGRGGARAGVKPDQGVGTSYFEQFADEPRHLENVRKALKGELVSERLKIRKGYFEIVYAPIASAGGFTGMVGVATDITERQLAERQVEELSVLKNTFINVVAHQLRTPLSAVRWNLELLISGEQGKLKKEQRDVLRANYAANGEVITRINDFLLAMDIEEGRSAVVKTPISVEALWQSVMIEVRRRCNLKELECAYEPPKPELPLVLADAEKLRVIFEKLADNAVEYTAQGSVMARLLPLEGAVRFEIEDTGIGIPAAEQDRVYHRFYRGSNAVRARTDASGLGLYIAKHYVEGHGGRIGFTSEEGKGSTFWFEIPLR